NHEKQERRPASKSSLHVACRLFRVFRGRLFLLSARAAMIEINSRIAIPDEEISMEFIRASGPGGQNVNKVSTAVRLRFDVRGTGSPPEDVRQRLIRLAGRRLGDDGFLTIHARSHRTQDANRREAIDRLVELIQRACERPKARRATRPTAGS